MKNTELIALGFLGVFAAISIVVTIFYLCYFIDCKNTNIISLIISSIFFFTFIFLNLLLPIDYYITTITEEDKKHIDDEFLIKFVTYFYSYFNRINSIMNLFVLPFMINCLETGYYSTCRIILESICRLGHTFWKLLKKAVIKVLLVIGLVLAIGVVILYYMFRKKYKLKEPLYYFDYISLASNIKSLIEIYINVGFFMVQIFIDGKYEGICNNQICRCCCCCCAGNPLLYRKYFFFSIRLIMEKTKKYINKIKDANKALNNEIKKYNNETNTKFYKFLLQKLQLIHADLELYKYKEDFPQVNAINQNNTNINNQPNPDIINESDRRNIMQEKAFIKVEIKINKDQKEEKPQKQEIVKDVKKESEKILAEHIRKYKKSTRKIKKLKKLFYDLTQEINANLNVVPRKCNCFYKYFNIFKYIIFYLVFAIVILTDIVLPFILYSGYEDSSTQTDTTTTDTASTDDDEDNNIIIDILIVIFGLILIIIITCSYTIITLYATNRRTYISGDYLSGKKINDSISLMKTIKQVCAYSFPLVYLNFYLWKIGMKLDLIFYEQIYIPDYELKHGIGIFMLAKIVVIIFAIIFFKCGCLLKNDMAEFNKNIGDDYNPYEDQMKFNSEIQNNQIYLLLIR